MGDMGDDFRAWKQDRIQKRAANRNAGAKYLADMGIAFEAKNNGAHLIVTHGGRVADYWPGTGKFKVRDGKWGQGVINLVASLGGGTKHAPFLDLSKLKPEERAEIERFQRSLDDE